MKNFLIKIVLAYRIWQQDHKVENLGLEFGFTRVLAVRKLSIGKMNHVRVVVWLCFRFYFLSLCACFGFGWLAFGTFEFEIML